jgi:hypothetical protein
MSASVLGKARLFSGVMAVMAFSALVLVGCGKSDNNPGGPSGGGLILPDGEAWVYSETPLSSSAYIFRSGGKLFSATKVSDEWTVVESGTWSISGNNLDMTLLGVPLNYTYNISGNTLTLSMQGQTIMTCTKTNIGTGTEPNNPGGGGGGGGSLVLGANEAWTATTEDGFAYGCIFRSNKELLSIYKTDNIWYGEVTGTYSESGNQLTVTISGEGTNTATYTISGNKLTITFKEDEPQTFTKTSGVTVVIIEPLPNIPTTTPTPLAEDVWANGSITASTSGGAVWYSFNVVSGEKYYVLWNDEYSGPETGTLDAEVAVIYSDGTIIFIEDDWDGESTPESFTADRSGIVHIRVSPAMPGGTGTFGVLWTTAAALNPDDGGEDGGEDGGDPGTGGDAALILGANEAWTLTEDGETIGFIFKSNKELVFIWKDEDDWFGYVGGTWSANGSSITLTFDDPDEGPLAETGTYSISGNTLTITIEGEAEVFTKTGNISYTDISGMMKSPANKKLPKLLSKK